MARGEIGRAYASPGYHTMEGRSDPWGRSTALLLPVCLAAALGTWCLVGAQSAEEGCWDKGKHCVRAQE